MYQTPILFIIFNRPDTTRKVFDIIRQIQPMYLFIAADGPRKEKPDDKEKCIKTRSIIELVDWDCEVKTLFCQENRGCGRGPAEAISWFFDNVEEGIILEDDCLPSKYFFYFTEIMLKKYRNNNEIMMVAGTNFLGSWKEKKQKYFFSSFTHTWGWATWKRAWILFDFELKNWGEKESLIRLKERLPNNKMLKRFQEIFDYSKINVAKITWWDFQWCYCNLVNNGLCLVPSINLITNIGIRADSTHTYNPKDKGTPILKKGYIIGNLLSQDIELEADYKFDKRYFYLAFDKRSNTFARIYKFITKKIMSYFTFYVL